MEHEIEINGKNCRIISDKELKLIVDFVNDFIEKTNITVVISGFHIDGTLTLYTNDTKNKYFTPNIEDLRVGYEYYSDRNGSLKHWIVNQDQFEQLDTNQMLVPYLTKEQIEAEGWRLESTMAGNTPDHYVMDFHKSFDGGFYSFSTNQDYYSHVYIWDTEQGTRTLYNGRCKCINELRTICKLLNIK